MTTKVHKFSILILALTPMTVCLFSSDHNFRIHFSNTLATCLTVSTPQGFLSDLGLSLSASGVFSNVGI